MLQKFPCLKIGIKIEAKSYRPIFLLPLISKAIGKSIHHQMRDYIQINELFYNYQSGFGATHCTNTYLSQLTDMILNGAENEKHTGMILFHLQKAFDTLDQKILLGKIK